MELQRVHGEQFVGSDQRNGDDGNSGADGHEGWSIEERLQVAGQAASAFGKDEERHSGFQSPDGAAEAGDGSARIRDVHRNLSGTCEMPANEGQLEQLVAGDDAELEREHAEEDRRIRIREVVAGVDGDATVETLRIQHSEFGSANAGDGAAPLAGDAMLQMAVLIPKRRNQRQTAVKGRGEEKQRRAQAEAHHALTPWQRVGAWGKNLITQEPAP